MAATIDPHEVWQEVYSTGTWRADAAGRFTQGVFPAALPDGRQIALPIRPLPSRPGEALASLIVNQASFAVVEALSSTLAERLRDHDPEVVVALPTLGLTLGAAVARALGHPRYVPLGTSRKFWYEDGLSVPLSSITSPGQTKRLYFDPRLRPLVEGRRIALVDDVLSTGASIAAALDLCAAMGLEVAVIGAAMLQTTRWRDHLRDRHPTMAERVVGVLETPLLKGDPESGWAPADPRAEKNRVAKALGRH